MNWYIGQEIICIKTDKSKVVIKGNLYTIKKIVQCKCCNRISLGVGVENGYATECSCCHCDLDNGTVRTEKFFSPLMDISELEQILNKKENELSINTKGSY